MEQALQDALTLCALGEEEGDPAIVAEAAAGLRALCRQARQRRLETLLSGEADGNDCYLEVTAGAGGTEAQAWACMLLRMYLRWAGAKGHEIEWLEESPGSEGGLKSASVLVSGVNAYGWLKTESGVHRLSRISPFDRRARRQTSFASAWIWPAVDEERVGIEVDERDLRIDRYRASGAGGQHVNRRESAVRITHLPTGTVVQCQDERSQHRNRSTAMSMLKARLYERELREREARAAAEAAAKPEIAWGRQIRSYVLQPQQLVKDLRTGLERNDAGSVLDGDIDRFLSAALAARSAYAVRARQPAFSLTTA